MPAREQDLLNTFVTLQIPYEILRHPAVFTVEEAQKHRDNWPGGHCKCLFLKDKKGRLVLAVVLEDRRVDLNALAKDMGFARFSFASAEKMEEVLGVIPGAVTPFALINCQGGEDMLTVILDKEMLEKDPLHYHPLHNEATVRIAPDGLMRFIDAMGHHPHIVSFNQYDVNT